MWGRCGAHTLVPGRGTIYTHGKTARKIISYGPEKLILRDTLVVALAGLKDAFVVVGRYQWIRSALGNRRLIQRTHILDDDNE